MKKKFVALFLCVLMLAGMAAPTASAASADEHDDHDTRLEEILAEEDCETDFCGRFFCKDCRQRYYAPISYEDIGMPIINITGSLDGISKEKKVNVGVEYSSADMNFSSAATLKLQGGTSTGFPKKNYSLQFLKDDGSKNKIALVDDWGKQSKYCLKANWVDFSQARNVVSGKLFSQIVHSRDIGDELNALPNGGVVDGYPVLVYLNGDLLGLYTMNIPKDKWMFGMKDETVKQALLFGNIYSDSTALSSEIADVNDIDKDGWELEYCSTEDDPSVGTAWVAESMNEFIRFLRENEGEDFKNGISRYTDPDRAIDVLIYTYFIHANDNVAKNVIWASYDGVKWIPSVYDLDGTWGLVWDGSFNYAPDDFMPEGNNLLFARLLETCMDEITARYVELREDILSKANINSTFESFLAQIPRIAYIADLKKWKNIPSSTSNNIIQIERFTAARIKYFDEWFGVTITEAAGSACKVIFNAPDGVSVLVYPSQDYTAAPTEAKYAWSVTKDGELTKDGGQIDFTVIPPEGYKVASVTAGTENSQNIMGPDETGLADTYRITTISDNLTVNISTEKLPSELHVSTKVNLFGIDCSAIWEKIKTGIGSAFTAIKDFFGKIVTGIKNTINELFVFRK